MFATTSPRVIRAAGVGLVAAVAAALAGCSSAEPAEPGAGDLKTVRVSLGWITNVEWAGFWLADANGYYAEEGLDIEWIGGGPNAPTTMATVAAGDADLGIQPGAQAWLASFADGNDWTAIGALYQDSPASIVSLASDPVTSAEDLVGKTVLGQEGTQIDYDAIFKVAGLEPDYEFIPAGFDIAPLVEGQGVAYTAYATNQPITLEEQYGLESDEYVVTLYSDLGIPTYGNIIYGDSAYVEDNGDDMEGFLRASVRGWQENGTDPAVAAELSVNEYGADLGLDLTQQTRENELQQPLVEGTTGDPLFTMDVDRMTDEMYPGLEAAGYEDLPAPSDYIDMSYLEAAAAGPE
ncbi:ABC-type nitrate/sulfonate/bicarbonate transport system substrate-binding protein [Glaciihabitans tibetensis]|uniref:Thiamine pyrimidine synthase n=1 Tax=Glaciihabitans tibetensis TaxID=1266600 RepID=A0A2T0VCQ2_9MICO|nr:ABC transporter substrate-binding protein [Glaciihabitans tibetensis]PRY67855.1 ABC-type nitrate/sulfonate/bicarbonate transport system substrate-binding protein [Glaciihabitans tibetensis]